jgi:hypothetical protein
MSTLTGKDGFWTDDVKYTHNSVKYKAVGNFVDAYVYNTECLPKTVKFIEKHHKNDKTIFWPYLESRHYAQKTLQ